MAVFPSFKLTEKGEELLNRSIGEGKTLTFTKFELGDGNPPSDFRKQTGLVNKFYEFPILNTSIQKDQVLRIKGYFDNKSFSQDKQLKEIGVFVKIEGNETQYLYSYTNAGDTGDIIPANSRGFYSRTLDVANYIGYATNITFNIEQLRDRYAFNTEIEMKVASYLKVGDKVELWGNLVLGDKPADEYIIQESGEIELSNGLFAKKVSFKYIAQTIEEMQKLALKVGDVVEVLGYYTAGDGAGHKRVIADSDDGSGVKLANGLWANIYEERIHPSCFGIDKNDIDLALLRKFVEYKKEKFVYNTITTLNNIGGDWFSNVNSPITFYGDSTTDGVGTSSFTNNPTNPVGSINHTEVGAPNAYCKVAQTLAREIIGNNTPKIYNAGYGGKLMTDGWALDNIEKAIFSNTNYADTKMVGIAFGLNDIGSPSEDDSYIIRAKYYAELEAIIHYCFLKNVQPVLVKSTPTYRLGNMYPHEMVSYIESIIDNLATKYNLEILNFRVEMEKWLNNNTDGYTWQNVMPDTLHPNDYGHRFTAGYILSKILEVIHINKGDTILSYQDKSFRMYGTYTKETNTKRRDGLILKSTELSKLFAKIVIYNNEPNYKLIYNDDCLNVSRTGYLTKNNLLKVNYRNIIDNKDDYRYAIKNKTSIVVEQFNIPTLVKKLGGGLNIIDIYLPSEADKDQPYTNIGYIEIAKQEQVDIGYSAKLGSSQKISYNKTDKIYKNNNSIRTNYIRNNSNIYDLTFGKKLRLRYSLSTFSDTGILFSTNSSIKCNEIDIMEGFYIDTANKMLPIYIRNEELKFVGDRVQMDNSADDNDECVLEVNYIDETTKQKLVLYNINKQKIMFEATYETPIWLCSGNGVGVWIGSKSEKGVCINYADISVVDINDNIVLNPSAAMDNIIEKLSDPVMLYAMEQERDTTKQDFLEFTLEKIQYDKQLEAEEQVKYEAYELLLQENPELTWEEFEQQYGNNVMMNLSLVERLEEPTIPESVKKFMEKYL